VGEKKKGRRNDGVVAKGIRSAKKGKIRDRKGKRTKPASPLAIKKEEKDGVRRPGQGVGRGVFIADKKEK